MKPLTITISQRAADLIREFSRAQGSTYASAVEACVYHSLQSGGPAMMLVPYGQPETKEEADGRQG